MPFLVEWEENVTATSPEGGDSLRPVLGRIEIEGNILEHHSLTAEATERTVEGPAVSDHVLPGLDRLTLDCLVTNHPIRPIGVRDGETRGGAAAGDIAPATLNLPFRTTMQRGAVRDTRSEWAESPFSVGVNTLQFPDEFDRPREVYEEFLRLKNAGQRLTITTSLRVYESMILVALDAPRDITVGDGLRFTADFQEIITVETMTAAAPIVRVERARPERDRGSQSGSEAATPSRRRSQLSRIRDVDYEGMMSRLLSGGDA